MKAPVGTVYLIHFERAYHHARHYVGWTHHLEERLDAHENCRGERLIAVIDAAWIPWRVVKIWTGKTRAFERQLKKRHGSGRFCPVCQEATA